MKSLNKDLVFEKLLKFGLFPEKMDKIFSSGSFGKYAIEHKIEEYQNSFFSDIKFRLTRNNNAPRLLSIPHPAPYFNLCYEIRQNWQVISNSFGSYDDYRNTSMIIPKPNNLNRRLVTMLSYDRIKDEKFLILDKSFKAKYFVHADITNCYPSIYSHSVPWALVGKIESKINAQKQDEWYNKLDKAIRNVQRNETVGIPIGPDTSSIICEIILSQIDKKLSKYKYFRFIDDYKCYCSSKNEADNFIRDLSKELESYNLRLNQKKTIISNLPKSFDDDWVNELKFFINIFLTEDRLHNKHMNMLGQFFDLIVKLVKRYPDESPIRYAVKVLSNKKFVDNDVFAFVILNLSRICFLYPYFIDLFDNIFINNEISSKIKPSIEEELNSIIYEHLQYSRSDVALWGVYLAYKYKLQIKDFDKYSDKLIEERDCLPVLLSYYYALNKGYDTKKYINLINFLIVEQIEDEWWLYIYEVMIKNKNKPVLKKVKYRDFYLKLIENNISFINESFLSPYAKKKTSTSLPF
ncbi:RNA-directed DNA polymerase [Flavobacterium magnesitis]|uniref:RNA-directed DNA polymerase n=1 Tax=Flavobacterium magnesitis TaxID=3138077 RepID=UPI00358F157A